MRLEDKFSDNVTRVAKSYCPFAYLRDSGWLRTIMVFNGRLVRSPGPVCLMSRLSSNPQFAFEPIFRV